MTDRYLPTSPFLLDAIAEKVILFDDPAAEENLRLLMFLTGDQDAINREWAIYLLAEDQIDTPAVRDILQRAAGDSDEAVRAEAILGLAQRDTSIALPLVVGELRADDPLPSVIEAAELCGLPQLTVTQLGQPACQPETGIPLDQLYTIPPQPPQMRSARG
ncbi:lyase [Altererythrobacter xixiisoli]|uniref:Lyase n=1 Tax=Croceibacterium xixiisoli TaxID=1476466 RepID=A0A6I4TVI0_9SPHN|nr:HEAT repeat domain-containing protein [Croceibacterium xixiisoli]MXO98787.1 lyase [Croceibacterium xixiisoli]